MLYQADHVCLAECVCEPFGRGLAPIFLLVGRCVGPPFRAGGHQHFDCADPIFAVSFSTPLFDLVQFCMHCIGWRLVRVAHDGDVFGRLVGIGVRRFDQPEHVIGSCFDSAARLMF